MGGRCLHRGLLGDAAESRPRALKASFQGSYCATRLGLPHLGPLRDLVLSPGDPTAAMREPVPDSHEHRTFSLQTLGMAPLILLVSAGRVAAASKRPLLLSGTPYNGCFQLAITLRIIAL
jgi:hypothetical protein